MISRCFCCCALEIKLIVARYLTTYLVVVKRSCLGFWCRLFKSFSWLFRIKSMGSSRGNNLWLTFWKHNQLSRSLNVAPTVAGKALVNTGVLISQVLNRQSLVINAQEITISQQVNIIPMTLPLDGGCWNTVHSTWEGLGRTQPGVGVCRHLQKFWWNC